MVFSSSLLAVTEYELVLKDHLFFPSRITIPAGKKVKLIIHNQDDTPEEFDSFSLNRQKVIFAKRKTYIFIGPLQPGEYDFVGEYNPNSARGTVVVVKEAGGGDVN
ncbi:MAG: cupredoxin domain-containing protein [Paraglaciecola sp.]|uniref:cupredoxin domain-containing protein n=1 Tax=Paraglaciecola sp. TaxID=1920173 RepID=UPI00273F6CE2|nr:cupredoxin domain-containing protein [Paraglaciecola sp.]MDP5032609.1 cupredoxin domain-containing protein [Paraglaciecola sp.]MDP5039969.1 cupredoxin domain-containing protein [Paraglaciecola sp.]MDP5134026.1 cupredoxin domain-containing protein [Paraglaciecola sp.]